MSKAIPIADGKDGSRWVSPSARPILRPLADPSVVCGVRVEDMDDPLMQKVRYLDKLVDE